MESNNSELSSEDGDQEGEGEGQEGEEGWQPGQASGTAKSKKREDRPPTKKQKQAAEQEEVDKLMKERLKQEGNPMEQYLRQMVTQQHKVSQVMTQMTFIYTMKEAQGGLQLPPGFLEWCVTGLSCEPQCC